MSWVACAGTVIVGATAAYSEHKHQEKDLNLQIKLWEAMGRVGPKPRRKLIREVVWMEPENPRIYYHPCRQCGTKPFEGQIQYCCTQCGAPLDLKDNHEHQTTRHETPQGDRGCRGT